MAFVYRFLAAYLRVVDETLRSRRIAGPEWPGPRFDALLEQRRLREEHRGQEQRPDAQRPQGHENAAPKTGFQGHPHGPLSLYSGRRDEVTSNSDARHDVSRASRRGPVPSTCA